ncbi:MAG: hypothetical protein R3B09_28085 [Nannocystaceae bacterium]
MSKVTIQRDICVNMVVPLTATHSFIPLPPFPPTPPPMPAAPLSLAACAIEPPVNAWWPPGGALGSHKFTTTVFHQGQTICLEGHDCGKLIPHLQVAPAPNNILTILHITFSSRKANFSAHTVKMNGSSVACMTMIAWPPTPMTYCSEPIRMPLADAPTSHLNSVEVGMTFGDWFAGAFAIAAGMVMDYVLFRMSGGTRGFGQNAGRMIARSRAGETTADLLASNFIGSVMPNWGRWAVQQGVGLLTGAVKIGATGEGSLSLGHTIGGPFLNLNGSVSVSHGSDGWTPGASATGNAGTGTGKVDQNGVSATSRDPFGRGQDSASHGWDGKDTSTHTSVGDPFHGFDNTTVNTTDGHTTVSHSHGPAPLDNPL